MSCSFGEKFKITIFGQSHSETMGVVIDGIPAGIRLDLEKIKKFMARRAPKNADYSTQRNEKDEFRIVSGIVENITCGAPLCALIENTDAHSDDYKKIADLPRPSHADFAAYMKHNGFNDISGGGNFSGRLTAPLCFAGAVAMQILNEKGIFVGAHILRVGEICDKKFDGVNVSTADFSEDFFPVLDEKAKEKMLEKIKEISEEKDSVGGEIECAVVGLPAGVGEPMFDGIENTVSCAVFAVPAVKGIEFGSTKNYGSENNDAFISDGNEIKTQTNNHGGILGGLSSGMPVIFKVLMKPTPSIGLPQKTVNVKTKEETEITVGGRHDACILPRAVPCIEAAAALAIINLL